MLYAKCISENNSENNSKCNILSEMYDTEQD